MTNTDLMKTAKKGMTKGGNGGHKKPKGIMELVKAQQPGFKMALPKGWDDSRFTRLALTALKSNPDLQLCTPESILGGLMLSAQLGLEPNTPLHEAVLIPYNNRRKVNNSWTTVKEAQFIIEYRGLIKLAWNSGHLENLDYGIIREGDDVTYIKGFDAEFRHIPNWKGKPGEPIAYYAVAALKGGGKAVVVMSREQVMQHSMKFSPSFNKRDQKFPESSPWFKDFDSMAIKTCLRELIDKKLPKATENIMLAIARDEAIVNSENGEQINLDDMSNTEIPEAVVIDGDEVNTKTGEIKEKKAEAVNEDKTKGQVQGEVEDKAKTITRDVQRQLEGIARKNGKDLSAILAEFGYDNVAAVEPGSVDILVKALKAKE